MSTETTVTFRPMNTNPRMQRWATAAGAPAWHAINPPKTPDGEAVERRGWNMRAPHVMEIEIPADAKVTKMKSPAGEFQHVNINDWDVNVYGVDIIPGTTMKLNIGVMEKCWEPVTERRDALRCWAWYLKCEPCDSNAVSTGTVKLHNTRAADYPGRKFKDICDGTTFAFVSTDGKIDQHMDILEPRRPRREKQPTAMAAALQAAGIAK